MKIALFSPEAIAQAECLIRNTSAETIQVILSDDMPLSFHEIQLWMPSHCHECAITTIDSEVPQGLLHIVAEARDGLTIIMANPHSLSGEPDMCESAYRLLWLVHGHGLPYTCVDFDGNGIPDAADWISQTTAPAALALAQQQAQARLAKLKSLILHSDPLPTAVCNARWDALNYEDLGIPFTLVCAIVDWHKAILELLRLSHYHPDPVELQRYRAQGSALAQTLAQTLGPDYKVRFEGEVEAANQEVFHRVDDAHSPSEMVA